MSDDAKKLAEEIVLKIREHDEDDCQADCCRVGDVWPTYMLDHAEAEALVIEALERALAEYGPEYCDDLQQQIDERNVMLMDVAIALRRYEWPGREALGGEQAARTCTGRLSDAVNSAPASSGVEADKASSVTPQPASPHLIRTIARLLAERMTHPMVPSMFLEEDLYDALQEVFTGEKVGEQAEGPRADLGAAVPARPSSPEPENEEIQDGACRLKPCPFCGESVDLEIMRDDYPVAYWIWCRYCEADGPGAITQDMAIERWNCAERSD